MNKILPKIKELIKDRELYNIKRDISVQDSRDLLEYLVNQALMEWQVYNIDPSSDNYMNDENIENSIIYITKKVIVELTDTSKARLAVGYPMETEEQIIETVKNRAKIVVLNYTIKQNNNDLEMNQEPIKNINTF